MTTHAECSVCHDTYAVRLDGNVRSHNRCPGSQQRPEPRTSRGPVPASAHLMATGFGVGLGWSS